MSFRSVSFRSVLREPNSSFLSLSEQQFLLFFLINYYFQGADEEYAPGAEPRDAEGNLIRVSRPLTPLERRIKKRQERFEIEDNRDDSKFLGYVAIAFVVPSALILAVAASTGYLDKLARGVPGL